MAPAEGKMLEMLRRKRQKAATPLAESATHSYTAVAAADTLLQATHRRQLLARIWELTALSRPQFQQLYLKPIHRYAQWVQQLPASETHHHAYLGGMLDHGLELVAFSLKLRQSYLLPTGAAPEDQAAQADAWSAAIAYAALLHDIGKIAVDLQVERQDGSCWHPWHGPLDQAYRFRYVKGRDYRLHGAAAGLLYTQVLDRDILDWLSGFPALWGQLLHLLAGQYEHAGVLGELVIQADRASTAQNLGGNPSQALQAPLHSLQQHLLGALRHLVRHELKLNQPGAAGWLTQDALWLVSKSVTDKLRAYLLAQAIEGIPSSNLALFDELQAHGLVERNSQGKAIWTATVTQDNWQQTFTFLRVQPALIWGRDDRPDSFKGSVTTEPSAADQPAAQPTAQASIDEADHHNHPAPTPTAPPADDSIDSLLDMFGQEEEQAMPAPSALHAQAEPPPSSNDPGEAFLYWVRVGIRSHKLIINDSQAKVHTVDGTAFLVTPGLFQRYVQEFPDITHGTDSEGEAWRWVQRHFEKLRLHRKRADGLNIWTCQVEGPRKKAWLKGYLLEEPELLFSELPMDNPYLSLVEK
jgi:integrating conjugative element relaxase (TIGR03760 family)